MGPWGLDNRDRGFENGHMRTTGTQAASLEGWGGGGVLEEDFIRVQFYSLGRYLRILSFMGS